MPCTLDQIPEALWTTVVPVIAWLWRRVSKYVSDLNAAFTKIRDLESQVAKLTEKNADLETRASDLEDDLYDIQKGNTHDGSNPD